MERIPLTPEDDARIAAWLDEHGAELAPEVAEGSNLVQFDHIMFDSQFPVVVLGGQDGAIQSYFPEWGGETLNVDLIDYITDRIGPNGETMPIFDPPEEEGEPPHVEHYDNGGEGGTP